MAEKVAAYAFENGLLLETSGADDEVIKIMPPLTTDSRDLQAGLDIIEAGVAKFAPAAAKAALA